MSGGENGFNMITCWFKSCLWRFDPPDRSRDFPGEDHSLLLLLFPFLKKDSSPRSKPFPSHFSFEMMKRSRK